MSSLFILSFILENNVVATDGYFLEISVAIIGGLLVIIGGFIKALYVKFEKMSDQVADNKQDIGLNKQKDESTVNSFEEYKKAVDKKDEEHKRAMDKKDDSLQKTLDGINQSVSGLDETTKKLTIQVAKLEAKLTK